MKRILALFAAVIICSSVVLNAQVDTRGLKLKLTQQAGKRWAICVGINKYVDRNLNSLKKAVNDAYGLSSVLKEQGDFQVFTFSEMEASGAERSFSDRFFPTKRNIEGFLSDAVKFGDIKPNDLVVFSFSGHGISDKQGNGYLLPLDWDGGKPYESAVPLAFVTESLKKLSVSKTLILVDACREEMSSSRAMDSYTRLYDEKFDRANVTAVFFATKQGGFSYEDPKSNYGAFTRFLVDGLKGAGDSDRNGLVTFRELSTFVEDGLSQWALTQGFQQRPFIRLLAEQSGDLALTISGQEPQHPREYIEIELPPPTPAMLAPANGATGVSSSPTLSWKAATGATSYGLQLSENRNMSGPLFDETVGNVVSVTLKGLAEGRTYYWRVRSANAKGGSGWSEVWSFTVVARTQPQVQRPREEPPIPAAGGTVTDIDGNMYHTVVISSQEWMVENLKVTHYRDGTSIPNVTDNSQWKGLLTGAYCNYDNNTGNVETYGRLYNWYAVNDSRGLAPSGWRVPTDADWQKLVDYLGGKSVAGGKLKETGTSHWKSPNTGATNESGFSALPGGCRNYGAGQYVSIGDLANFWSSTELSTGGAWGRYLHYGSSGVARDISSKRVGFSVRCVRDK